MQRGTAVVGRDVDEQLTVLAQNGRVKRPERADGDRGPSFLELTQARQHRPQLARTYAVRRVRGFIGGLQRGAVAQLRAPAPSAEEAESNRGVV